MNMTDHRYEVVVYWHDDDHFYVAEAPELSGCRAYGATRSEAMSNIEHAISLWIDTARLCGDPIPQPQGRMAFH